MPHIKHLKKEDQADAQPATPVGVDAPAEAEGIQNHAKVMTVQHLIVKMKELMAEVAEKNIVIANQEQALTSTHKILKEKISEITHLTGTNCDLTGTNCDIIKTNSNLTKTNSDLTKTNTELRRQLSVLKNQIDDTTAPKRLVVLQRPQFGLYF